MKSKTFIQYLDEDISINLTINDNETFGCKGRIIYKNERRKYLKNYVKNNKDKIIDTEKKYRNNNKGKIKERSIRYYNNNKDKIKKYQENNKEKIKVRVKESEKKYKETRRKYLEENKNKLKEQRQDRYRKNIKIEKEYSKIWHEENKEKQNKKSREWNKNNPDKTRIALHKQNIKRKSWGKPIFLNLYFYNSELHHIHVKNKQDCFYIPADLHQSIRHRNTNKESMSRINNAVKDWILQSVQESIIKKVL